jgi:large subunit ribosomal protein L17
MRHNKSGRKLGRNSGHRNAMLRNMVTSLLEHGRITTTDSRAKELRKLVDRMITLGKRGDLHARRQVSLAGTSSGRHFPSRATACPHPHHYEA